MADEWAGQLYLLLVQGAVLVFSLSNKYFGEGNIEEWGTLWNKSDSELIICDN